MCSERCIESMKWPMLKANEIIKPESRFCVFLLRVDESNESTRINCCNLDFLESHSISVQTMFYLASQVNEAAAVAYLL